MAWRIRRRRSAAAGVHPQAAKSGLDPREPRLRGLQPLLYDIGNGNLIAFFDFAGLVGPYAEVLGGSTTWPICVDPERWAHLEDELDSSGVEHLLKSVSSIYLHHPDATRVELISDPLGEMHGETVLSACPLARSPHRDRRGRGDHRGGSDRR